MHVCRCSLGASLTVPSTVPFDFGREGREVRRLPVGFVGVQQIANTHIIPRDSWWEVSFFWRGLRTTLGCTGALCTRRARLILAWRAWPISTLVGWLVDSTRVAGG